MTIKTIAYFSVTDWQGVYVDGKLFNEGSDLYFPYVLESLAEHPDTAFTFELINAEDSALDGYVCDNGGFPKTYIEALNLSETMEYD